ncbi:MAG: ComF family protein [Acidobacteria bacterium]|nr:ComF family protein [Acidobacteriota bacterium]
MNSSLGSIFYERLSRLDQTTLALRDAALAMLFPLECRVCGAMIESLRDGVACADCWLAVEQRMERIRIEKSFCAKCGMPLPPASTSPDERFCGRCDDLAFSVARAGGVYEGALRESVLRLKSQPHIPVRLRELLNIAAASLHEKQPSDSIIPVPLHPDRLKERTFNQAEIIANALSKLTHLPVDTASLIRAEHTEKHRAGMGARERARSLENAFQVRAPRLIENKVVLLVDDVMTTGSTANEIARTLLNRGAQAVNVLTLARAASDLL